MSKYQELKDKQAKDINEFQGIFFAFSNNQFREGMEKVGLKAEDTKSIYSLGAGGYIRKDRGPDWGSMLKRHKAEMAELKKEEKALFEALVYELNNHEYSYTGDIEPALDALGLEKKDIEPKILAKAVSAVRSEDAIN